VVEGTFSILRDASTGNTGELKCPERSDGATAAVVAERGVGSGGGGGGGGAIELKARL
jgi:hypothetical protein